MVHITQTGRARGPYLLDHAGVRWVLATAIGTIGVLPALLGRTIPDTAFLLYAAERVLDGARLYVDIVEVNPPLVIWLNVPVVLLAESLDLPPALVYQLGVLGLAIGSLLAARWVLRLVLEGPPNARLRRALVLTLVVALLPLARLDYGEREHLALLFALPFLLSTAARLERRPFRRVPAALIGLAAGIGIALKPHFAVAVIAREGALLARFRRRYRPGPEVAAAVGVGVLYVALVAVAAPEYADVVRALAAPYHLFLRNGLLLTALLGDGAAFAPVAIIVAAVLIPHAARPAMWATLIVVAGAFWVSAVLQFKGWRYHFFPSMALALALMALVYLDARRPLVPWTRPLFAAIAFAVLATTAVSAIGESVYQAATSESPAWDPDPDLLALIPEVRDRAAGRPVLVLSGNMASAWPLLTYAGAAPVLRYTHPWVLVAAYQDELRARAPFTLRAPGQRTQLEQDFVNALIADLNERPPGLIIELRPGPDRPPWGIRRIDWLDVLRMEPALAAVLERYTLVGEIGQYRLYQPLDADPAPLSVSGPTHRRVDRRGTAPDRIAPTAQSLVWAAALVILVLFAWYREKRPVRVYGT